MVQVKGHRAELEDDDVQCGGQVGKQAWQRILRGSSVERRVVDLVTGMRIAAVDMLEEPDGESLERTDVRRAPAHERAVHTVVSHAALVWLVEAAAVLGDTGTEDAEDDGLARVQPREDGLPRRRRARMEDRAVERHSVEDHAVAVAGGGGVADARAAPHPKEPRHCASLQSGAWRSGAWRSMADEQPPMLSLLELDYQRTLAASREQAAPPLAEEEVAEAMEAAAAEGYSQLGALPTYSDDEEEADCADGYQAFQDIDDDEDEDPQAEVVVAPAAPVAAPVAAAATATASAIVSLSLGADDTPAWSAEFPEDEDSGAGSSSLPPPPPPQPLSPARVEEIKGLMAGINLAPPTPRWASTVPESVWMTALLRKTPVEAASGDQDGGRTGDAAVDGSCDGKTRADGASDMPAGRGK